jgi:hypothetical protein
MTQKKTSLPMKGGNPFLKVKSQVAARGKLPALVEEANRKYWLKKIASRKSYYDYYGNYDNHECD